MQLHSYIGEIYDTICSVGSLSFPTCSVLLCLWYALTMLLIYPENDHLEQGFSASFRPRATFMLAY
jgi:hypothetical protein